jgi:hypothetical protein
MSYPSTGFVSQTEVLQVEHTLEVLDCLFDLKKIKQVIEKQAVLK